MKRLQGESRRVVVAMSGGVDSSTVAGLLVEAGHDVVGVMMKLYDREEDRSEATDGDAGTPGQCCSLDDVADARRVAEHLGIPFYVGNYRKAFDRGVIQPFVDAYADGQTPNPCVRCNDTVKFRPLLARARALGADYLATGHYVRTELEPDGRVTLWQGRDVAKDQSYFVAGIPAEALDQVVFPLGSFTKVEVRDHATRMGLPVADKAESQDICFIPDGDYASFLERRDPERFGRGGAIVSLDGLTLGRHRGVHRFTIGQRRGLGLAGPEPRYVVALDPASDTVVVGSREAAQSHGVRATRARWHGTPPPDGAEVVARIRYRHRGVSGWVTHDPGGAIEVRFREPVSAVTPGQQLVLYDGERVLAAATIEGSIAADGPGGPAHDDPAGAHA